jgi:hypothetical protein
MNELRGIGIYGIISPFNDKFYKEQTWACLDIVDETCEPSSWHLISFLLISKCVHSNHTHANEQDIKFDDYKSLNPKCHPLHILVHHRLQWVEGDHEFFLDW